MEYDREPPELRTCFISTMPSDKNCEIFHVLGSENNGIPPVSLQMTENMDRDSLQVQSLGGLYNLSSYSIYPGKKRDGEPALTNSVRCRFDSLSPWSICSTSTPNQLCIYSPDGSQYDLSLPFDASLILPMKSGLLFQPVVDMDVTENSESVNFPTLFTLAHPLEEVKPVEQLSIDGSAHPFDESEILIFASQGYGPSLSCPVPLLVTYNIKRFRNSIWSMKPRISGYDASNSNTLFDTPQQKNASFGQTSAKSTPNIANRGSSVFKRVKKSDPKTPSSLLSSAYMPDYEKTSTQFSGIYLGNNASQTSIDTYSYENLRTLQPDFVVSRLWTSSIFTRNRTRNFDGLEKSTAFCMDCCDNSTESETKIHAFLVCILDSTTSALHAVHVEDGIANDNFHISNVISAVSFHGSNPEKSNISLPKEMLVLDASQDISLYRGSSKICRISTGKLSYIWTQFSNPVGNSMTFLTQCKKSLRMSVNLNIVSIRVKSILNCLDSMNASCSVLSTSLQVDIMRCADLKKFQKNCHDREWNSFLAIIKQLLRETSKTSKIFSRRSVTSSLQGEEREQQLRKSNLLHYRKMHSQADTLISNCLDILDKPEPSSLKYQYLNSSTEQDIFKLVTDSELFFENRVFLLQSIHMTCQDFLTSNLTESLVHSMSNLAIEIAKNIKKSPKNPSDSLLAQAFLNHANRCCASNHLEVEVEKDFMMDESETIPCIYDTVYSHIVGYKQSFKWGWIYDKFHNMKVVGNGKASKLNRFYSIIAASSNWKDACEKVVLAMIEENFISTDLEQLPIGLSLQLLNAVHTCSLNPPLGWPQAAYDLLKREDIGMMSSLRDNIEVGQSEVQTPSRAVMRSKRENDVDIDGDGLAEVEAGSILRFPIDHRVREVCRMLRSNRTHYVRVDRPPEISDLEYVNKQQQSLYLTSVRKLASCSGRGMLSLGGILPSLLQDPLAIPIPALSLTGKVFPGGVTMSVDLNLAETPKIWLDWPEFHNGVASGLRIAPSGGSVPVMTRAWVLYNRKGGTPSKAHDGLLLGLGLQGHLGALTAHDIARYLKQIRDGSQGKFTTVGCLLGLAADRRGSGSRVVHRALRWHMLSQWPTSEEMPSWCEDSVQTAALFGLGLLHQSTGDRLVTELLLEELGLISKHDKVKDRQSYSLAAGLALGMVNLARGFDPGLSDLHMEARLLMFVVGGKDPSIEGGLKIAVHNNSLSFTPDSSENPSAARLSSGKFINIDITAVGAVVALGLIYMGTNDKIQAARLSLPDTHFLLDYVRPDLLMLRVISRSLILWDSVRPNEQWIKEQLPKIVSVEFERLNDPLPKHLRGVVDRQSIKQAHAFIVSGACFSLGLRYAGTTEVEAKEACLKHLRHLKNFRDGTGGLGQACRKPEKSDIETCICCTALGLAMIMAGTGDIECLRIFRELRWRVDNHIPYGTHMALAQAIGLLFLQGGKATLKRDPPSIAALMTAFYPRYPNTTYDNRYHLQALRHFYVLAVQRRCVEAIDISSGLPVSVCLSVTCKNLGSPIYLTTPCPLPEIGSISTIDLVSKDHLPLKLRIADDSAIRTVILTTLKVYVKLSSIADANRNNQDSNLPSNMMSIFRRYLTGDWMLSNKSNATRIASIENLVAPLKSTNLSSPFIFKAFCSAAYSYGLSSERGNTVFVYMGLVYLIQKYRERNNDFSQEASIIWNIRLVLAYYYHTLKYSSEKTNSNLNSEFVETIRVELEHELDMDRTDEKLRNLYSCGCSAECGESKLGTVALLLRRGSYDELIEYIRDTFGNR